MYNEWITITIRITLKKQVVIWFQAEDFMLYPYERYINSPVKPATIIQSLALDCVSINNWEVQTRIYGYMMQPLTWFKQMNSMQSIASSSPRPRTWKTTMCWLQQPIPTLWWTEGGGPRGDTDTAVLITTEHFALCSPQTYSLGIYQKNSYQILSVAHGIMFEVSR